MLLPKKQFIGLCNIAINTRSKKQKKTKKKEKRESFC